MSNYLVIANKVQPFSGPALKSPEVFDLMMRHGCWEYTDSAPYFPSMEEGDLLFFYLGGPGARYFAGEARVAGPGGPITKDSPKTFNRSDVPFYTWRLPLKDVARYEPQQVGLETLEKVSWVVASPVERKYIGLLLRVGCRKLTPEDVKTIRRSAAGRQAVPGPPGPMHGT